MRKWTYLFFVTMIVVLAGCNSPEIDPDPTSSPESNATAVDPTSPALVTVPPPGSTDTPLPEDYPPPPTPFPTPTLQEGYLALPTLTPKYPAADTNVHVRMLRPLGIQCEDPSTFLYATLDDAVTALEEEGVEVIEAEMVSLPVTESCDSPTSEHFLVLINAEGLDTALELGWRPES